MPPRPVSHCYVHLGFYLLDPRAAKRQTRVHDSYKITLGNIAHVSTGFTFVLTIKPAQNIVEVVK